jgi:hypothetical protein
MAEGFDPVVVSVRINLSGGRAESFDITVPECCTVQDLHTLIRCEAGLPEPACISVCNTSTGQSLNVDEFSTKRVAARPLLEPANVTVDILCLKDPAKVTGAASPAAKTTGVGSATPEVDAAALARTMSLIHKCKFCKKEFVSRIDHYQHENSHAEMQKQAPQASTPALGKPPATPVTSKKKRGRTDEIEEESNVSSTTKKSRFGDGVKSFFSAKKAPKEGGKPTADGSEPGSDVKRLVFHHGVSDDAQRKGRPSPRRAPLATPRRAAVMKDRYGFPSPQCAAGSAGGAGSAHRRRGSTGNTGGGASAGASAGASGAIGMSAAQQAACVKEREKLLEHRWQYFVSQMSVGAHVAQGSLWDEASESVATAAGEAVDAAGAVVGGTGSAATAVVAASAFVSAAAAAAATAFAPSPLPVVSATVISAAVRTKASNLLLAGAPALAPASVTPPVVTTTATAATSAAATGTAGTDANTDAAKKDAAATDTEADTEAAAAAAAATARHADLLAAALQRLQSGRDGELLQLVELHGVAASFRRSLWMQWAGAATLKKAAGEGHFRALCGLDADGVRLPDGGGERAAEGRVPAAVLNQIDADVRRTCPEHDTFRRAGGLARLRRVLVACADTLPEVGYTQSMNFVASLLLLVCDSSPSAVSAAGAAGDAGGQGAGACFSPNAAAAAAAGSAAPAPSNGICSPTEAASRGHALPVGAAQLAAEEDAFWLLVCVTQRLSSYYSDGMKGLKEDSEVLRRLLQHHAPAFSSHMDAAGFDLQMVTPSWFLCLFFTWLPSEITARVWDLFFLAGPDDGAGVLLWVSTLLVKHSEPAFLAKVATCERGMEMIYIVESMKEAARTLKDFKTLVLSAGGTVGGVERFLRVAELRSGTAALPMPLAAASLSFATTATASASARPRTRSTSSAEAAAPGGAGEVRVGGGGAGAGGAGEGGAVGGVRGKWRTPAKGKGVQRVRSKSNGENLSSPANSLELQVLTPHPCAQKQQQQSASQPVSQPMQLL